MHSRHFSQDLAASEPIQNLPVVDYLLPIVLFAVPVMLMIALTVGRGRELKGSCGGVGADGRCSRCGKPAAEIPTRNSAECP